MLYLLYPCSYFDKNTVDFDYKAEFDTALSFLEFKPLLYDYDALVHKEEISLYPKGDFTGICIYRGWMLKPELYYRFYHMLQAQGLMLINNPEEYKSCHLFPLAYQQLLELTPKCVWFPIDRVPDAGFINKQFKRFMMKDYVKSLKGTEFKSCFQTPLKESEWREAIHQFKEGRGDLFTGGIVCKEFVDLKKYNGNTNEYRVYYLKHQILSITRNSNQPKDTPFLPIETALQANPLNSNFYTCDFAELENGEFILLETGDGQVSGLSPNQPPYFFYDGIRRILTG